MMGERVGGDGPGDPKKKSFARRAIDWIVGLFGRGVDKGYKSNVRLKANNRLEVGLPTRISEEEYQASQWDAEGTHYQQVSQNTLLTSKIGSWHERGTYQFILPQNFGGWSQDNTASDGLIYKGCLSCHADNGAFTYAVKNSSTAGIGKSVGLVTQFILQTYLFTPVASGVKNLISIKNTAPQIGEEFGSLGATIVDGKISLSGRAVSNGKFDFVVTASGEIKIGTGHYNLSGGAAEVQAAGEIKLFRGRVMSITNSSGHYQPSVTQGQEFGNILQKAGVNISGAKLRLYNTNGTLHSTTILK